MTDYNNLIKAIEKSDLSTDNKEALISLCQEHKALSHNNKVLTPEEQKLNFNEFLIKLLRILQIEELLDKFL